MLLRLLLVATPILSVVTAGFAATFLYGAVIAARQGSVPFALIYAALGVGGVALSVALWRTWRTVRRTVRGG